MKYINTQTRVIVEPPTDSVGALNFSSAPWEPLEEFIETHQEQPETPIDKESENGGEEECSPSEQTATSPSQTLTDTSAETTEATAPTEADGTTSPKKTKK